MFISGRPRGDEGGGARQDAGRDPVQRLQGARLFQHRAGPGGQQHIGHEHGNQHDEGDGEQHHIVAQADIADIDQRRRQRDIEQHGLRIAERHQQAGEEGQADIAGFLRRDVLRQQSRRPEFPGNISEIEGAGDLDGDKDLGEGLRHEGKAENDGGEIGHVAEHQAEAHEEGLAKIRAERAGDDRGDPGSGNGGGDKQRSGIGKQGGKAHGWAPSSALFYIRQALPSIDRR
ncbi:hypothetical protein RHECNPAF_25300105 [Rhizobium etli CNPAF512]|nr:hypothetical protein RHECNPAF_25300105 [Rhizobium etli CNPAF512]